jgi:hypothetical protein
MSVDLRPYCKAFWKMNDNAPNTTVVDSQGYSDGTAQQNTNLLATTGKVNGALKHNGTSDYESVPVPELVFQSDFLISLWSMPTDGQPAGSGRDIFGTWSDDYGVSGLVNLVHRTTSNQGRLNFGYGAYQSGGQTAENTGSVFVNGQETWHHIVCIAKQATSNTVTLSLYFDGVLVGSATATACVMSTYSNDNPAFIGQASLVGEPQAGFYFYGSIDNVEIFSLVNIPYTIQEIVDFLWNGGSGTEELTDAVVNCNEMWLF